MTYYLTLDLLETVKPVHRISRHPALSLSTINILYYHGTFITINEPMFIHYLLIPTLYSNWFSFYPMFLFCARTTSRLQMTVSHTVKVPQTFFAFDVCENFEKYSCVLQNAFQCDLSTVLLCPDYTGFVIIRLYSSVFMVDNRSELSFSFSHIKGIQHQGECFLFILVLTTWLRYTNWQVSLQ